MFIYFDFDLSTDFKGDDNMNDLSLVLGIDFNNLLLGSYYGEKLINSKGNNVNAIKGFFFKLRMLKDIFTPDYIVFANDVSRERTFRRRIYNAYKAQRKPHDPDIVFQLRYASRLASLIGYPFISNDLYEADDILGMISRFVNDRGMTMIIASSDRDMYQLITDKTFIYSPRGKEIIDLVYMYDHYRLNPQQWIELKILQGDRSDNIPGIPGVGEKTALQLMQHFGSIENIYRNLTYLKPSLRDLLVNGRKDLDLTRELVTIVTDYTRINMTEDMLQMNERFENEVYELIEYLEIHSLFNVMKYGLFQDKEDYYGTDQDYS